MVYVSVLTLTSIEDALRGGSGERSFLLCSRELSGEAFFVWVGQWGGVIYLFRSDRPWYRMCIKFMSVPPNVITRKNCHIFLSMDAVTELVSVLQFLMLFKNENVF